MANRTVPRKRSPKFQSWLDEIIEYGRILLGTVFLYGFFRFMTVIGMEEQYVKTLETIDQVTTVVVFGAYSVALMRRAVAGVLK